MHVRGSGCVWWPFFSLISCFTWVVRKCVALLSLCALQLLVCLWYAFLRPHSPFPPCPLAGALRCPIPPPLREVVRGGAPRSRRPTMATSPPQYTRYISLPCAAPVLSRSSTHSTHCAAQHPPRGGAARSFPTTDSKRHNPHPCAPCVAKGTQHAQQRHKGEGRGPVWRSPKEGLSTGTWRRKVVMSPRRGNGPASGHPRAHQPPLGRGTSPPAWDGRLDLPGQRRRHLPSSACSTQRSETGQVRGLRWHNQSREWKGKQW